MLRGKRTRFALYAVTDDPDVLVVDRKMAEWIEKPPLWTWDDFHVVGVFECSADTAIDLLNGQELICGGYEENPNIPGVGIKTIWSLCEVPDPAR